MILDNPNEFTARRVRERLLAGEDVISELEAEVDEMSKGKGDDAAKKAADEAAERGRQLNAKLAKEVADRQAAADAENRKNWS